MENIHVILFKEGNIFIVTYEDYLILQSLDEIKEITEGKDG